MYLAEVRIIIIWCLFIGLGLSGQAQVKNPFDIERSDTEAVEAPTQTEAAQPIDTKLDDENPFSVSHIPIRKNQYKEIERLALPRGEVQENISLAYLPLWLIIFSMCILAYLLFMKRDHLAVLIKSFMNDNFMKLSNYEANGGKNVVYLLGYFLFLLNFSLLLYLICTKLFAYNPKYLYWGLLLLAMVFFWGKHLVSWVGSWILRLEKETSLYDFTLISIYNLVGVVLLVLNILMVFGPQGWVRGIGFVGIGIFIISLLSRYYKTLRIGQSQLNSNFFHFFLYFCAFEMAPWVIVFKVVKDLI